MGKPCNAISREKKVMVKSLVDGGATYRSISRELNISAGSISNIIKEFRDQEPIISFYKKNRADILALDQATYRSYITPEKLTKASARDLEIMRGIAHDHERLERGESTQNVAMVVEAIEDLKKRRAMGRA